MLVAHLAIGCFAGVLAAVASLLMGFSLWGALGFYILGGNLGAGFSIMLVLLRRPQSLAEGAQSRAVATEGEYQAS